MKQWMRNQRMRKQESLTPEKYSSRGFAVGAVGEFVEPMDLEYEIWMILDEPHLGAINVVDL